MSSIIYIIKGKTMYILSNYDGDLSPYYKIMKDINTLIFDENREKEDYSAFNQPIVLSRNIKYLRFGSCFNQPIILTKHINVLILGHNFNQPIILTPYITYLLLSCDFNRQITLTSKITHLTFGICFNQPVFLPRKIAHLTLGFCFNQPIILSRDTRTFQLGAMFNQPIVLSSNMSVITIHCKNCTFIDNLPNNIQQLKLGYCFDLPLFNIPSSVKKAIISKRNYKYKYAHLIEHVL